MRIAMVPLEDRFVRLEPFEEALRGEVRVEIITDAVNAQSQAAILKLGAKAEGVLRKHKITWTGRTRDTAIFAVIDDDWPEVLEGLDRQLAAF